MRWFKIILILIILVFLGLFLRGLYVNNLKVILSNVSVGESVAKDGIKKLTFNASYAGFIPATKATIEEEGIEKLKGKDVYHIKAEAEPNRFINRIYRVKAEINSFIDRDELCPLKFTQILDIPGKPRQEKIIVYDQANHTMNNGEETRMILPNTQGPLSILFYLMHHNLKLGEILDFNLNTNQKNLRFYAKVLEKQKVQVNDKVYEVYLIEGSVKRRSKSLRHSSEFKIWFSNKPFQAPVLIKVFTPAGPIVVRTVKID